MQPNTPENFSSKTQEDAKPISQHHQSVEEQDITPETLQQFNRICLEATQLMNDYKNQSIALKQEIAGMVSIYQKNSSPTEAVPVQKIIAITNQYEQGMKQANKQYNHLASELKNEEHERDLIMLQIKDCFDKLEKMETKIKAKKLQQQNKLKQTNQPVLNQTTISQTETSTSNQKNTETPINSEQKN